MEVHEYGNHRMVHYPDISFDREVKVLRYIRLDEYRLDYWFYNMIEDKSQDVPIVAWVGDIGTDWAAYMGLPENCPVNVKGNLAPSLHLPSRVVQHGMKMDEEDARRLFPEFSELKYRR